MKFLSVLFVASIFLSVLSCAHKDIAKSSPPLGQTKSEVVEAYGSPSRTWRTRGQDHWLYDNQSSIKKILVFESNRLIAIKTPSTESEMDDLEGELRKLKGTKPTKFESLSD